MAHVDKVLFSRGKLLHSVFTTLIISLEFYSMSSFFKTAQGVRLFVVHSYLAQFVLATSFLLVHRAHAGNLGHFGWRSFPIDVTPDTRPSEALH